MEEEATGDGSGSGVGVGGCGGRSSTSMPWDELDPDSGPMKHPSVRIRSTTPLARNTSLVTCPASLALPRPPPRAAAADKVGTGGMKTA